MCAATGVTPKPDNSVDIWFADKRINSGISIPFPVSDDDKNSGSLDHCQ